jgi:hypothetical protein
VNVSVRLSATGTAPRPVVCGDIPDTRNGITGLVHQVHSRVVGETEIIDTFFVFPGTMQELLATNSYRWIGQCYPDGTEYDLPGQTIVVATPNEFGTFISCTYSAEAVRISFNCGCFVNGNFFYGTILSGAICGGDYP